MSCNIAIKVENLSKCYQIYDQPRDRLKQFIIPRLQRSLGMNESQYYREFWALDNVSFEVNKGETIGIIGRNGSGKSTLLQIISGTLNPTVGRIQANGRIAALLELGSGFNPEFTGRENVYMSGAVLGLTKEEIDKRFDQIIAFADIGDFIEQPVKTYSSGMTLRLAFSVIAHVDADILIIDEALAVGDAFFTQKCMRYLRKFMENGTVLFVSHDTASIINLCQRAIWLNKGIMQEMGDPKIVAQMYLTELYEQQQGESAISTKVHAESTDDKSSNSLRDMRLDYINNTKYRNDIELLRFQSDSLGFGKGGGYITSVIIMGASDEPLSWVVGGEIVKLRISCQINKNLFSPIVGFYVNDRLGQALFGDNTFNFSKLSPLSVRPGQILEVEFEFRMPILPAGDYSITVALAEGSQQEHVQHHWLHEALLLKSHSSSVSCGLVGVPMNNIRMNIK